LEVQTTTNECSNNFHSNLNAIFLELDGLGDCITLVTLLMGISDRYYVVTSLPGSLYPKSWELMRPSVPSLWTAMETSQWTKNRQKYTQTIGFMNWLTKPRHLQQVSLLVSILYIHNSSSQYSLLLPYQTLLQFLQDYSWENHCCGHSRTFVFCTSTLMWVLLL